MARRQPPVSLLRGALLTSIIMMSLFILFTLFHSNSEKNDPNSLNDPINLRSDLADSPQASSPPVRNSIKSLPLRKRVAYAITVTKDSHFLDGALVLGYSAKKVHNRNLGYLSEYDADLVAFVTVSVTQSRPILEAHGWKVLEVRLSSDDN